MLIVFAGPSTIGKDTTWLHLAEECGFRREVPYTSRPQRHGELDGYDYHFVTVGDFQHMIRSHSLTDWDFTLGHYYGTGLSLEQRSRANEDVSLQALARMSLRLKMRLIDVCTVMLLTSDMGVLEKRLRGRGYQGRELALRLDHGAEEETHAPLFDFVVPDADILPSAKALRVLEDIISARSTQSGAGNLGNGQVQQG